MSEQLRLDKRMSMRRVGLIVAIILVSLSVIAYLVFYPQLFDESSTESGGIPAAGLVFGISLTTGFIAFIFIAVELYHYVFFTRVDAVVVSSVDRASYVAGDRIKLTIAIESHEKFTIARSKVELRWESQRSETGRSVASE